METRTASPLDPAGVAGHRQLASARPTLLDRGLALSGAAFVVAVLAGNSLTESAAVTQEGPAGTAAELTAGIGSTAVTAGIVLELLGLLCLAVFGSVVATRTRRAGGTVWPHLAFVGAALLVAVKLSSAAPYLAARALVGDVPDDVVHALVETNGAAFVLCWVPMALLVGAAAASLRETGLVGPVHAGTGYVLAVAGLVAGVVGVLDHRTAFPVAFLLSLVWVAVTSVRLALRAEPA